jgi:hypothetical protein
MITVHIEHPIREFDAWKRAFDSDPIDRQASGVRSYRILRPTDDLNYVMIDLDFDNLSAAEAALAALGKVWQSATAQSSTAPALSGSPQTRIGEVVDSKQY